MTSSSRVILNTLFLYGNMIVTIVVQLLAVRLLMNGLGVEDFGLYNLIAGIIVIFAFMNVAMAAASQRFLSFAMGEGSAEKVKTTFAQSLILHSIIGIAVILALETGGIYYVNHVMNVSAERIDAARFLWHCITISTFVNIITVPYESDIQANEDMGAISLINIFDYLLRLAIALFICYGNPNGDALKIFGVLTMAELVFVLIIKRCYCLLKYPESRGMTRIFNRSLFNRNMREMAAYASWNFIGVGCMAARYQGTAAVINYFFTLTMNAAYAVAQQVNNMLIFFSNTIVRAIRPQVVKSEGAGNRERMLRLSVTTSKITSLMVCLIAIPLFIVMPFILQLWLGHAADENTVMFCRGFLLIVFINQLTIGLQIGIESEGHIRKLQVICGTMHLLPVIAVIPLYKMGCGVSVIITCIIIEEILGIFVRVAIARKIIGLKPWTYLFKTILPVVLTMTMIFALSAGISNLFMPGWTQTLAVTAFSTLMILAVTYFTLLDKPEKNAIDRFLKVLLLIFLLPVAVNAQNTRSLSPDIRTVRVLVDGKTGQLPLITLGEGNHLNISFDALTHEYERYEYRVVHCDRNWNETLGQLMSDVLSYNEESLPIEDYEYSFNTTQLYTHYHFNFPNSDITAIASGNYRLDIARDGDYENDKVAEVCFMVAEKSVQISSEITTNTEIDWNRRHQQVNLSLDYGSLTPPVRNPREEIHIVVLQNQRWDNAAFDVPADYINGTKFIWQHARGLIFPAGNEYRRIEMTSTYYPGLGLESMRYFEPCYHATVEHARPRRNYDSDEDRNGEWVVRTVDDEDSDVESEYVFVHFVLKTPEKLNEKVFVQGQWTEGLHEMEWDEKMRQYEAVVYLKQGYYSYQFVGEKTSVEGDFYQTENQYSVLVYYKSPQLRYERLVGVKKS